MCHCTQPHAPSYYHVVDENTGEHVATYTSRFDAYRRAAAEALDNGRDFCAVTAAGPAPPTVVIDGRAYYDGELISRQGAA